MRMRELETRTGVNRETVRFYIREGLLPEPARQGKTSAKYDETHVVRLRAIKRLQEERHLPLAIIKALLNAGNAEASVAASAFPGLEADLTSRLRQRNAGKERLDDVATRLDIALTDLQRLAAIGFLKTETDAQGIVWLSGVNITLAEQAAALNAAGLTEERGFAPETLKFYLEFVEWLVGEELRLFLTNMAGKADTAETLTAAERGIDAINEILGLLRTRLVLDKLHDLRNPHHNDNS